jgi:hypothetical protein
MSNFSLKLIPLGKVDITTRRGRPGGSSIRKEIHLGPKYYKNPIEITECTYVYSGKRYPYNSRDTL